MQYKVHGVDAETGKKVKPLDIAAPDLREAATLAKIRGVLPTRITPVTELLTIVKEPEPGTDGSQTKRTTLISIEGRPLWFAATLVVGLLIAVMWFALPSLQSDDHSATAPQPPIDDEPTATPEQPVNPVVSTSADDRWRKFHLTAMESMGTSMYLDNYIDSDGLRLTLDDINVCIFGGVSHMFVPDVAPYKMQWRLQSGLLFPDDISVSFLDVYYEGPFSHELAVAAVKEFYRVTGGIVSIEEVRAATQEAESLFFDVRARKLSEYGYVWEAESRVPETVDSRDFTVTTVGEYLIKVRIQEWPIEAYTRETGSCRMMIYFAFCPPGVTEVKSIHASGF